MVWFGIARAVIGLFLAGALGAAVGIGTWFVGLIALERFLQRMDDFHDRRAQRSIERRDRRTRHRESGSLGSPTSSSGISENGRTPGAQ